MGFNSIQVYDADFVEVHNLPNQFYRQEDLNKRKVEALAEIIYAFERVRIQPWISMFHPDVQKLDTQIVISAVDSMDARARIIRAVDPTQCTYIDSRMGGELMRIYSINSKERMLEYASTLKKPEEEVRCTMRTILYNVLTIAGIITSLVRKIAVNQPVPYEVIFDIGNYMAIRND